MLETWVISSLSIASMAAVAGYAVWTARETAKDAHAIARAILASNRWLPAGSDPLPPSEPKARPLTPAEIQAAYERSDKTEPPPY